MSMEIYPMSKVNLSSSVKNYLYQYIRSLDQTGSMKLPPESEPSQKLGVSRVTVRRALDEMEKRRNYITYSRGVERLRIRKR